MSANSSTCPQCGTQLKPGVPGGLCLSCLLSLGLKAGVADSGDSAESLPQGSPPEIKTDEFGRFRIIKQIGEGGCGVVYRAEQLQPIRREVALKVIKLGMDTGSVIARFEAERQALALMDHPGIAKVFDAGTSLKGRPFFAMELVSGERITDYCDGKQLSIAQRLELFARVCEAVQHAHQKGIIHRDLKPSNILVSELDGVAQPKVIDFGIAKATSRQRLADQTVYTAFEQFVGTPAYMSPEQAGATSEDVDTRSDIYSLGVLLYELLTGRPPFEPERLRQAAVDEVFRIIRDEDPARPSARLTTLTAPELSEVSRRRLAAPLKLVREVRGDLDWVVMKALEKLPARRYETANALAAEVRRHLNHEPVRARPPSGTYRFQKMVQRNRLAFAAGTVVVVALIAGAVISTWGFLREKKARERAVEAEGKATTQAIRSDRVARLLKEVLAGAGPSVALGRDTAMLRDLLNRATEHLNQEVNDPAVEIELRETIGRAYYDLKDLDKAEGMHREVLRLRESLHDATNAAIANSLMDLATVLNTRAEARDLAEAEPVLRRALVIRTTTLGYDHLDVADTLQELARNLRAQRNGDESEKLYREALAIRRKLLEPGDSRLLSSLNALALVLSADTRRLPEAEVFIREAIEIQEQKLPEGDPVRINTLATSAHVLESAGRWAEAEAVLRQVIALRRKLYGDQNELTADDLNLLAFILMKSGKYDEAEALVREAIALHRKTRGDKHPRIANNLLGVLADVLKKQQKWAEAEAVCREWVPLLRKVSPDRPETLLDALDWFSAVLMAQHKWSEAEPVLRECLELCCQLHEGPQPSGSKRCMGVRRRLGETLLRLNKPTEAEPLLLASYESLKENPGKWELIDCEKSMVQLIELYETTNRPDQVAVWQEKLAEFRKVQAATSPAPPAR